MIFLKRVGGPPSLSCTARTSQFAPAAAQMAENADALIYWMKERAPLLSMGPPHRSARRMEDRVAWVKKTLNDNGTMCCAVGVVRFGSVRLLVRRYNAAASLSCAILRKL